MKTLFTNSPLRTLFITFVIALSTLNLAGQTRHTVAVTDYVFTPAALTVSVGDTVVWTNTGDMSHNVNGRQAFYPENPTSFGNDVGLDWTYEYVFDTAGVYNYRCDPHFAFGMVGSVTVNPALVDTLTLTVNFTAMTPHVGQSFYLAVIDSLTKEEIGRVKQTATQDYSIEIPGLTKGASYWIDFWADHNGNGVYDAPSVDHAWRLPLDSVLSDTIIEFVHNTDFTDIDWKTKLTVHFTEMDPHLGQMLTIYVRDLEATLDTVVCMSLDSAELYESSFVIEPTKSYTIDIWADHNSNGTYDAPPADHAWRLPLDNVVGDTILEFVHNTNFTDIEAPEDTTLTLTVNFTAMTPHVGQTFWLAVVDTTTRMEIGRVKQIATADFSIEVPRLEMGKSYHVDFWADHNGNGVYDAPPADHAWRLPLDSLVSDTIIEFVHNTDFTDIAWKTKLTVHFTAMTPHLGQTLTLYVKNLEMALDTVVIEELDSAEFNMSSWVIEPTMSYTIDIWADHNSNGTYDAPPADHAWRLLLDSVVSDTIIEFVHNTNFFDISIPTPNEKELDDQLSSLRLYPNPANQYIDLLIPGNYKNIRSLKVYSVAGLLIDEKVVSENVESYRYDVSRFKSGVYFMEINSGTAKNTIKFLKQ